MRIAEKAQGHAIHHSDAVTFQGIECVSGLGNCPIHIRKRHTCEEAESAWMFCALILRRTRCTNALDDARPFASGEAIDTTAARMP